MTQAARPARTSPSKKVRPCFRSQSCVMKYSLSVPVTTVLRLSVPKITVTDFCPTGATARTLRSWALMASISRALKGLASELARPGPNWPGDTNRRLLPSFARSAVTLAVVPLPIVTMAITAPTPMMMPSTVRNERSVLRRTDWSASLMASISIMPPSRLGTSASTRPSTKWMVRRAKAAMSGSCVTMMIVMPCSRFSRASRSMISRLVTVSRLPVGSSASRTSGSVTMARAMATRCCWPPDSSAGV